MYSGSLSSLNDARTSVFPEERTLRKTWMRFPGANADIDSNAVSEGASE